MNSLLYPTEQRRRGGYYTPEILTHFITKWINECEPKTVLEPSCGDGAFIEAIKSIPDLEHVTMIELDPAEWAKTAIRADKDFRCDHSVLNADFMSWSEAQIAARSQFDAIVGNPPYIRYQFIDEEFRTRATALFTAASQKVTKHANAWVSFVMASIALLRPGGRLGMVVPAELMHISYAEGLRNHIADSCRKALIIETETLWFEDTQQGTVLLMLEKKFQTDEHSKLYFHHMNDEEWLSKSPNEFCSGEPSLRNEELKGKWTNAYLPQRIQSLYSAMKNIEGIRRFGDVADIAAGIVTGANDFFIVPENVIEKHNLSKWTVPMITRSEECRGIVYDKEEWSQNIRNGMPVQLLLIQGSYDELDQDTKDYLKIGEEAGLDKRYKCRVRKPWYTVPAAYSTSVGLHRRIHTAPKPFLNNVNAVTTSYRLIIGDEDRERLVAGFVNPLTALSAELEGRYYGGGVLELVPSEIEKMVLPFSDKMQVNIQALDNAYRTRAMEDVYLDDQLCPLFALGISKNDIETMTEGWLMMKARRQKIKLHDH